MNENGDSKSGSQVFEKFLGSSGSCSEAFETSESPLPRVSFERQDEESLSAAYGRVSLVRHYKRDIYISLGKHCVHIEGQRLRPLYDALHQEKKVVRIVEQPVLPADDFAEVSSPSGEENVTAVRKISWPDALSMEG